MPSIQAKMISGLFNLIGVNRMLDKQGADFEKLLESYKENMMHCWGAMEFVPEARAVRQEYFKALR